MITKIILKMFIRFDKTIISRPVKESAWVAVQSGYGICVPLTFGKGRRTFASAGIAGVAIPMCIWV